MVRIVVDKHIPFLRGVLEPFGTVDYYAGNEISKVILKDADALIIRTRTQCNANILEGSNVKFVGTATIGYDHIDTDFCEANGITWVNAPGCNAGSVMQYLASVLSILIPLNERKITLGIVGVGHVGRKVADIASLMGFHVLLNDPPRARTEGENGFVSLEEILKESDVVSLHAPLVKAGQDATFHLFDEKKIAEMKPGSLLINTSRGEVVETGALKAALKSGHLKGAVLDVWENEPCIDHELLNSVTIGTPHIAGYSADGKANGTSVIVNAVSRFFQFPLSHWYPVDLPKPPDFEWIYPNESLTKAEALAQIIMQTYDIRTDDRLLRQNPALFESLRGNYSVRREFGAYTFQEEKIRPDIRKALINMGFSIS